MGLRNKYNCDCGYSIFLDVGSGLLGKKDFLIKSVFSEVELDDFFKAKNNGEITEFYLESLPSFCPKCNSLSAETIFKYFVNNEEKIVTKACSNCNGDFIFFQEEVPCPQCGKIMNVAPEGHWD